MSFQMSLGLALTALERLDAGNLKDRYAIHRISGQVLPTRETRSCDLSGGIHLEAQHLPSFVILKSTYENQRFVKILYIRELVVSYSQKTLEN